jgi:tRNA dimethylallyltransferase
VNGPVPAGLVLAIFGPTGAGKSAVAEALADRIPADLVSADSMQVYEGLPILTNQPRHPTRLVAIWALGHDGSVGEYERLAHAAIDEILASARTPVVVGGTGLYLRAALADLNLPPAPKPEARRRFEGLYAEMGAERAHALLAERDPGAAAAVHAQDRRRVVRALELHEAGESLRPAQDRLWSEHMRHPTIVFGLDLPRHVLAERIEARTRAMFEAGVEEEVHRALTGRLSLTARKVMGLREVAELPREQAIAALTRRTVQYASYQRKWLRRLPGVVSLSADRPLGALADEILEVARTRQRLPADRAGGSRRPANA